MAIPMTDERRRELDKEYGEVDFNNASGSIANKIRRRLRVLGMTQAEFAARLNTSPANVSRYLGGKTNFELRTLLEIERAIDVHIIDRDVIPQEELMQKFVLPQFDIRLWIEVAQLQRFIVPIETGHREAHQEHGGLKCLTHKNEVSVEERLAQAVNQRCSFKKMEELEYE